MNRLKIGIITHNFPTSDTDRQNAGIFVYDLAKALSQKSEVVVFSPGPENIVKNLGGIRVHFFKFNQKLGNLKLYNPGHLLQLGNFFINGRKSLDSFLNKNPGIDFIISMWAFPSGFFAYNAFKKKNIPYAIYSLGSDIYIYAKRPLVKNLVKKYLNEAGFLLADSPDLVSELEKITGKKATFLPSASNFPGLKTRKAVRSKKIVLTFLGRMEKIKGVDIFVNALILLQGDIDKFTINFIGDGSFYDYVKTSLNDYPNAKLWGNLDNTKKIAEVLRNSDWLVIPSRSDSIPLVFSEAMKLSLPVIAADLPDLKYLVKKYKVGYLFKSGSIRDLTSVLRKVLTEKENHSDFRVNTIEAAKIFDLSKSSDKLISLIKRSLRFSPSAAILKQNLPKGK